MVLLGGVCVCMCVCGDSSIVLLSGRHGKRAGINIKIYVDMICFHSSGSLGKQQRRIDDVPLRLFYSADLTLNIKQMEEICLAKV